MDNRKNNVQPSYRNSVRLISAAAANPTTAPPPTPTHVCIPLFLHSISLHLLPFPPAPPYPAGLPQPPLPMLKWTRHILANPTRLTVGASSRGTPTGDPRGQYSPAPIS